MQPTCVPDAGETRGIARKGQRNPAACWRRAAIHLGSDRASGQGRTRGPRLTSVSAPWTLTEVASAWSASSALSGASPAPPCRGEAAGASSSSMDMRRHRAHSQEGPSLLGRPAGTPPSLSPGWEKIRTTNTTAHMLYSFSLNFQSSFRKGGRLGKWLFAGGSSCTWRLCFGEVCPAGACVRACARCTL
jgi:hypothetical protein